MLTASDVLDEVRLALRHELDARISPMRFVNRLGRRWIGLHQWGYLSGRQVELSLVAGTDNYALPADILEVNTVHGQGTGQCRVKMVSWPHFSRLRAYGTSPAARQFCGALNREVVSGTTTPKLHLAPVPAGPSTLTVVYRAGWAPVAKPEDEIQIPVWAEEAFLDLARAMALGLSRPSSEGNPDPLIPLIAQVRSGDAFQSALADDGLEFPEIHMGQSAMDDASMDRHGSTYYGPQSTDQDLLADL